MKMAFWLLWQFQLWRWFVVCVVQWHFVPSTWRDWLAYHSGLLVGLEELFRRDGDWPYVNDCRAELRRWENS